MMCRQLIVAQPSGSRLSLEYQHLVGYDGCAREFVHRAATCPLYQFGFANATRIHAGAAQEHRSAAAVNAFQHPLHILIAVGRLLTSLAREYGIRHQEYGYLH